MRLWVGVSLLLGFLLFQNCAKTNFGGVMDGDNLINNVSGLNDDPTAGVINVTTDGPAVCDPLGGGGTTTAKNGLVGNLYYVPKAKQSSNIKTLSDVIAVATKADGTIYMSQFNVPTRKFQDGFSPTGGEPLKDDAGEKLVEYFGLHMQTNLVADQDGYYQLATVSDDGFVVTTKLNGVETVLAGRYDQIHSTRSDCGSTAFALKKGERFPLEMYYYQGPREKIAAVLLWRKVADPTALDPKGCNLTSDDKFFAATADASAPMEQMASVGWQVVPTTNFSLPGATTNPCVK